MSASISGSVAKASTSGSTGARESPSASRRATRTTASTTRWPTASKLWTPEAKENLRSRHELIQWAAQLDRTCQGNWSYFLTMTFGRREIPKGSGKFRGSSIPKHHALSAGPKLVRWCSRWTTVGLLDSPSARSFRLLLWSAESHASGDVHLHALSVNTQKVLQRHCDSCASALRLSPDWKIMKESWWLHHGRCTVFPYDPALNMGAERYVTKYVLDESCLDWGIEEW